MIKLLQYVFGYAVVKLSDIATITRGRKLSEKKIFVKREFHAFIMGKYILIMERVLVRQLQ